MSGRGGPMTSDTAVVRPDWEAPAHVEAFCTTRSGGTSAPPYDSLNLGLHVGDDEGRVRENRRRLVERLGLPSEPVWLRQVHGTRVVEVGVNGAAAESSSTTGTVSEADGTDEPDGTDGVGGFGGAGGSHEVGRTDDGTRSGAGVDGGRGAANRSLPEEADGAWTEASGRVVAVLTADCLPVVATDAAGSRVAVAHAGWRGLAAGVLDAMLAPFSPGDELHVWLGPAIGPGAFEIGAEVREAFVRRDAAHDSAFVPTDAPGKYLGDLYALARRELARGRPDGGVAVTGGEHCTVTEATRFHSHRRDGTRSGRMATVAWLREGGR